MIEHRATCPWNIGDPCDCGSARPERTNTPPTPPRPTGAGNELRRADDLAQRLAAMGDVLREAVNVVAVGYDPTGKWYHVDRGAFLALADAVERARKAAGR